MLPLLLAWLVVTLGFAVGLLAFLVLDEWQVRRQKSAVPRPEQDTPVRVVQAAA
jgi:hypothetical protein